MEGCVACAAGRPTLITSPAPLHPDIDHEGYTCLINLTKTTTLPDNGSEMCRNLAKCYPHYKTKPNSTTFRPVKGKYVCFKRNHTNPWVIMGEIPEDWCDVTISDDITVGSEPRAGLWWYCGGTTLLMSMQIKSQGRCAMVRLVSLITLIGLRSDLQSSYRTKRSNFDLSSGSPTYVDAMGIPRGVPNGYG